MKNKSIKFSAINNSIAVAIASAEGVNFGKEVFSQFQGQEVELFLVERVGSEPELPKEIVAKHRVRKLSDDLIQIKEKLSCYALDEETIDEIIFGTVFTHLLLSGGGKPTDYTPFNRRTFNDDEVYSSKIHGQTLIPAWYDYCVHRLSVGEYEINDEVIGGFAVCISEYSPNGSSVKLSLEKIYGAGELTFVENSIPSLDEYIASLSTRRKSKGVEDKDKDLDPR